MGMPLRMVISHYYRHGLEDTESISKFRFSASLDLPPGWSLEYNAYYDALNENFINQSYTLRRDLHCWEAVFVRHISDVDSGFYFKIKSTNIRQYTGLQVAWDPGVNVVWLACIVMILGLYIAFFVAHKRVWVRVDLDSGDTAVLIAGTSNRNPATFEREFERAMADLKNALKGKKK